MSAEFPELRAELLAAASRARAPRRRLRVFGRLAPSVAVLLVLGAVVAIGVIRGSAPDERVLGTVSGPDAVLAENWPAFARARTKADELPYTQAERRRIARDHLLHLDLDRSRRVLVTGDRETFLLPGTASAPGSLPRRTLCAFTFVDGKGGSGGCGPLDRAEPFVSFGAARGGRRAVSALFPAGVRRVVTIDAAGDIRVRSSRAFNVTSEVTVTTVVWTDRDGREHVVGVLDADSSLSPSERGCPDLDPLPDGQAALRHPGVRAAVEAARGMAFQGSDDARLSRADEDDRAPRMLTAVCGGQGAGRVVLARVGDAVLAVGRRGGRWFVWARFDQP